MWTRIPLIVGGRSDAAVSRAARLGDGWLGIWVSPRRFSMVREQIVGEATDAGRDPRRFEHALNVWCGFAPTREGAREPLAAQMELMYQMPFEPFERYSPYGTPEHVAEFLSPYIEAGCSALNVIPCASITRRTIIIERRFDGPPESGPRGHTCDEGERPLLREDEPITADAQPATRELCLEESGRSGNRVD